MFVLIDEIKLKNFDFFQAHQQIRLGDIQASEQKWMTAIEYYLRAIGSINSSHSILTRFSMFLEDFKAVEMTLTDPSLISIIQAQIIQCEKAVQLCQLKEQADQVKLRSFKRSFPLF